MHENKILEELNILKLKVETELDLAREKLWEHEQYLIRAITDMEDKILEGQKKMFEDLSPKEVA